MPHAAVPRPPRRPSRLALVLAASAAIAWLASGLRNVPAGGDRLYLRAGRTAASARVLAPGWTLAPPLVTRVASFPRGPFQAVVRLGGERGGGTDEGGPQPASREGVSLLVSGTLTLRVEPSRAAGLLDVLPGGWDAAGPRRLSSWLRAPLARLAARTPYPELVQPPAPGVGRVPRAAADALAAIGLVLEEPSDLAFYPLSRAAAGTSGAAERPARRVLLIGLDGADWDLVDPLMRAGRMPNLQRLVDQGARARLKAIAPVLSPILWTSIATGVGPERHGIVDFLAVNKSTGDQIPVTSNMRRVKAIWNILSERGLTSGVVGWWASWPAEPVSGFIVSDRVAYQLFGFREQGEGLRRRTWPEALGLVIQPLIVAPDQVDAEEVSRFLPPAARAEPSYEEQARSLRTILASARTYAAIGLDLLRAYDPDLKAIYLEGTDTVAHSFMRYRRPRMAGVSAAAVEAYGEVVDRFYEHTDAELGRILQLADARTLVLICSDHGFRTGANRPHTDPRIGVGGAADWHRKFGILVLSGPGVRRGADLEDASILDVTPTILAAMGLPVARDMEGRALVDAFEPPLSPAAIGSYEPEGKAGAEDPLASELDEEIVAKLTALGYISQEGTNALNNTGITLLERGRFSEAADVFRRTLEQDPGFLHGRINLGRAQMLMNDHSAAIASFQEVLRQDPDRAEVHNLMGNIHMELGDAGAAERAFRRALQLQPEDADVHNSLGILYERTGRDDRALREYERVVAVDPDYAEGFNNIGLILRKRGDPRRAIEFFQKAIGADADFPGSYNNEGLAWQDLGELDRARASFERGLEVDPDNAVIVNNLGTLELARGDREAARRRFEQAIAADPDYPSAYNNLGAVLGMLGRSDEAFERYLKAVELDPGYTDARFNLARSLLERGRREEAVAMLEKLLEVDAHYGKAHLQLALLRIEEGRMEEALEAGARASRAMAASPDPHNLLADIYLRLDRREEALRELSSSLALDPDQPRVRELLGRLRSAGG